MYTPERYDWVPIKIHSALENLDKIKNAMIKTGKQTEELRVIHNTIRVIGDLEEVIIDLLNTEEI